MDDTDHPVARLRTEARTCPVPGIGPCDLKESVGGSVTCCGACVLRLLSSREPYGNCGPLWWNEVQLIVSAGAEADRRLRKNGDDEGCGG